MIRRAPIRPHIAIDEEPRTITAEADTYDAADCGLAPRGEVGSGVWTITAVTWNSGRQTRSTATTVHPDGSQTVQERRTSI